MIMNHREKIVTTLLFFGFLFLPHAAHAASLLLSPSSGSFSVDSTFEVSVFLDTQGKSVNTVSAVLNFPADKLQLVSPTTGKSIISIWTAQPKFDNADGVISLQGGIPNGINVSKGLITTLTFRVKRVGIAVVKFSDSSDVLLNDGKGTSALENTQSGVYELILPPPAGPIVASETHPDQTQWYPSTNVILKWEPILATEGYSYILSDDPTTIPDNISLGIKNNVVYKNLGNGTHYFHIKSLRDGIWGGVTHFAINIDNVLPADFKIEISPSAYTSSKNQIVNFITTDDLSGIDRYEYKVISLKPEIGDKKVSDNSHNFFIEAESPQILNLGLGSYDIIVRAFDKAGNVREVTQRLNVVVPLFEIVSSQGIRISGLFTVPWIWCAIIFAFIFLLLLYSAWRARKWHKGIEVKKSTNQLPLQVKNQLSELQKYRQRYGKILVILMLFGSLFATHIVKAEQVELSVPFVSTVSRNISNEDIFYIGGKTDTADESVIIYLQNLQTGETISETVNSDKKGNWFYRYPTFLSTGNYILWAQTKLGEQISPPSPQIQMNVRPTAIQFGGSRLSYESLYFFIAISLLLMLIALILFIGYHLYHGRKKHKIFEKEVREAEESVRRGFAVLKRDIEAELVAVRKAGPNGLSKEVKQKEQQLLRDLESIGEHISKEVWDIERTENLR